jgi:hypothetical protein
MRVLVLVVVILSALSGSPFTQGSAQAVWTYEESGTRRHLRDVWGTSANDVYVVGDAGTIRHYDGTKWTSQDSGTRAALRGVHGSSSSNVFAVGDDGTILHFDGKQWAAQPSATKFDLEAVWCAGPSDAFAVGVQGTTARFHDGRWSAETTVLGRPVSGGTDYQADLLGVWGSSASDVVAVGAFLSKPMGRRIVGGGLIVRFDGQKWVRDEGDFQDGFTDVWGRAGDAYCTAGFFHGLECRGRRPDDDRRSIPTVFQLGGGLTSPTGWYYHSLTSVFGVSDSALLVTTSGWQAPANKATDISISAAPSGLRPFPRQGLAAVLRYDGSRWTTELVVDKRYQFQYPALEAIWAAPSGEAVAVGEWGAILRRSRSDEPISYNRPARHWIGQLKNPDRDERRLAAAALLSLGPVSAVPALMDALKDQDTPVRATAARALGEMGPAANSSTPALVGALSDREWPVRFHAATALGDIGTLAKDALPGLRQVATTDQKLEVRQAAEQALRRIGG